MLPRKILILLLILLENCFDYCKSSIQIQRSIVNKRTNQTNLYSLRDHFKNCDTVIKNKKFSFITSSSFPDQFPLPIYCKWIIDQSSFTSNRNDNQTLIIYLNEVYVKRGIRFTEYSYYLDDNLNIDKRELPIVNFNSNLSFISTKRKYLVVRFQIDEKINPNLNARILDSSADHLNGFNLTFELSNRSSIDEKEICTFKKCNFNGRCMTRLINNSVKFKCDCFNNYHGKINYDS